jgi:hypothetical protein
MQTHITVNPKTFAQELDAFIKSGDAQGFMSLSQAVKAAAIELIHHDQHFEASYMMKNYAFVFVSPKTNDPAFLLKILPAFPQNTQGTLKLLGLSDELDQAILTSKVELATMKADDGFESLINWAIGKEQWSLIEDVVVHLAAHVKEHHPDNSQVQRSVVSGVLQTFVYGKECLPVMPATIDEALVSLVNAPSDWRLQGYFVDRMARMGMPKTLMKMLEYGRIDPFACTNTAEHQHILDCLPEQLTIQQMHAVDCFLGIRGIKHRLLFDETTNIDKYIEVLRESQYLSYRDSDLRFATLERYSPLFTTENIAMASRRKRISRLLNAVVDKVVTQGGTPEGIRGSLKKCGVPDHAMKLVDILKGGELENALGL